MTAEADRPVISVMLAVPDAAAAARWYAQALGATELWDLGGVVGLTVAGAPFFRRRTREQWLGHPGCPGLAHGPGRGVRR